MKYTLAVVIVCVLSSGCIRAEFAPTRATFVASYPKHLENIEVYRTERPSKPYEEIGTIYVRTTVLSIAIDKLKIEAANNGGDAIIDIKVSPDGISGTVVQFK